MGGGSTPAPPQPVAVPSAADEEAATERARLYSMLRGRRRGSLAYAPVRRSSLLTPLKPVAAAPLAAVAPWLYGEGGGGEGMGGGGEADIGAGEPDVGQEGGPW